MNVKCPGCSALLSVRKGTKARCPKCREVFAVDDVLADVVAVARPRAGEDRDREEDRPARKKGYRCRWCDTDTAPVFRQKIGTGGWILLAMICVFPFNFIGLAIKDDVRVCPECGGKV